MRFLSFVAIVPASLKQSPPKKLPAIIVLLTFSVPELNKPPPALALLPLIVLLAIEHEPSLSTPPPTNPAELPLMVLLMIVSDERGLLFAIPPPFPPEAWLLLRVQPTIARMLPLLFSTPPPAPFLIVNDFNVTLKPLSIMNTEPASFPFTVEPVTRSPWMVTF